MHKTYGLFFHIVSIDTNEKLHTEIVYTNTDINIVKSVLQDQIKSCKNEPYYSDDTSAFFPQNSHTMYVWDIK